MKLPKIQKIQGLDPNGIYWVTVGDKDHCPSSEEIIGIREKLIQSHKEIKWIVAPNNIKLSDKHGNRHRKANRRTQKSKN